jgi:hypothetical protein
MSEKREDVQSDLQEDHRQRKGSKKPDLTTRREKSRVGPCGEVDTLQNKKKNTAHRAEAGNVETPAPNRYKKKKQVNNNAEVTEVYGVPLGTSVREEGAVVVVGE